MSIFIFPLLLFFGIYKFEFMYIKYTFLDSMKNIYWIFDMKLNSTLEILFTWWILKRLIIVFYTLILLLLFQI